ncbi:hypothetical protein [Azospirillum argentinense]|uniref:CopG family transcriptional regulator n=1 Tax=Azospirillum brasilense TaxID=192 RepID=A0A4D8QEJ1_AZOBR|nr:hypothetical protein [Azospirillum argentinense]QCO07346.1 hypothetical protein D3867_36320 [Azospirillum argentinense]
MQDNAAGETTSLTIRIPVVLKDRLERATKAGPYEMTMTSIVLRGVDLALQELAAMEAARIAHAAANGFQDIEVSNA